MMHASTAHHAPPASSSVLRVCRPLVQQHAGANSFSSEHAGRLSSSLLTAPRRTVELRAAAVEDAPAQLASQYTPEELLSAPFEARDQIRNIAIIAHIDHGKTTLVDAMLKQSNVFRDNQKTEERVMDSNSIERERGITILSKNTAVTYKGRKINIIDTPGHADFGGEVERVLNMCDGVLLLVDSVEGPMPQTRFVLRKALDLNKKVIVVVNKIDRAAARPDYVIDTTFDLFVDLGATDEQCDFPVVYASGANGIAGDAPETLAETLEPLFECIVREARLSGSTRSYNDALLRGYDLQGMISRVSPPMVRTRAPLQLLVTNLDYDEHKGRICIGRVTSGKISKAESVAIAKPGEQDAPRTARVNELFVYNNFAREAVDVVEAGDICALTGIGNASIGDTICSREFVNPLPTIEVEEPTVRMTFLVNTSPFAGREGKYVTSRNIKERLERELERNLALRVEPGESADQFIVSGRGSLHISILIENMRREGYEFAVGPPTVITKEIDGKKCEPFEEALLEVPEEHMGPAMDLLGQRKGQMLDMAASTGEGATQRLKYRIPTRGLLGLKNAMLTATKGTAVLNTHFADYAPWLGDISVRELGSLTAYETGQVTTYALMSIEARGRLFVSPGQDIYEGQVIGIHQRNGDLAVNACKKKAATNIRSATKDATTVLSAPIQMGLDDSLEYLAGDELIEVTPESVRIRKNPMFGKKR